LAVSPRITEDKRPSIDLGRPRGLGTILLGARSKLLGAVLWFLICLDYVLTLALVYYMPNSPGEAKFAEELHERIRREFPEVGSLASASKGA
jgi:hypothetical protein